MTLDSGRCQWYIPRMATPTTRLREKRQERGLSLRQVAKATSIPRSVLQRIETGAVPAREHARALYVYYDYEIDLADIYDPLFDFEVGRCPA